MARVRDATSRYGAGMAVNRIGVDLGGTFTDLVSFDSTTGIAHATKVASTPADPGEAVLQAVRLGMTREQVMGADLFIHASTVGLNALLERKGATVGLLTTRGFRDVLELRRGDRDVMYDLLWTAPPPLVPRRLRCEVAERVLADGSVEKAIDLDDVEEALHVFRAEAVDSIAVVFLHSCINPVHELAAEHGLREHGFRGDISVSHRLSGERREYERSSTTVVDAYIRPRVYGYLRELKAGLADLGFSGACVATTSGGGALLFEEAEDRVYQTIMSGPAAGAVGAGDLCVQLGIPTAVSADVGGTSFDTCLITSGRPGLKYEATIAGMPLQTPWVDVRSIGAGGGSVAYLDVGGLLRVGPRSAGAEPGPVCYGKGGNEPTVTDAAAALGMLGDGQLAGGLALDLNAAERAISHLADALGLEADDAACGVLHIVTASMAEAIREVTVEVGVDPRDATLIVFGGAGPLLGGMLAAELEMAKIVVPALAGNFSARSLLVQDLAQTATRTVIRPLDAQGLSDANGVLSDLYGDLRQRLVTPSVDTAIRWEVALDIRYRGQAHSLTVTVGESLGIDPAVLQDMFAAAYERTFGHTMDGPAEIVAVRASAHRSLPLVEEKPRPPSGLPDLRARDAYSFCLGRRVPFAVVVREALALGATVAGPAIILEETATSYVDIGYIATVHPTGCMIVQPNKG